MLKQAIRSQGRDISTPLSQTINRRIREVVLILTAALSLFLLLALASHHPADPGWAHITSHHGSVANLGGKVGAIVSDIFLSFLGYLAYIVPVLTLYAAWIYFRHRFSPERNYFYLSLRSAGFLFIVLGGCALLSLGKFADHHGFDAGGYIGHFMGASMVHSFNWWGGHLILVAMFLCGITLFTGLSWLKLIDKTGQWTLFLLYLLSKGGFKTARSLWQKLQKEEGTGAESHERIEPKFHQEKPTQKAVRAERVEPVILTTSVTPKEEKPASILAPSISKPQVIMPSLRSQLDTQTELFDKSVQGEFPSLSLLDASSGEQKARYTNEQLEDMSREVELRLQDFGVEVKVVAVHPGPVVTRYELQLAAGTKVSKISVLAKDLARSLSVVSVRVVEVIPGKSVIGLELPNEERETVRLREILASQQYDNARSPLTLALGKDIAGHPVIVDLAKMPHLLVAGTTGSGKSVGLNAMLLSFLYKATPDQLRLIMIDPKMLELAVYEGIPHLLTPVVTDMKDAANALRWCVVEMDRRYRLMASLGVRNISGYNSKIKEANANGVPLYDPLWTSAKSEQPEVLEELPYIVVLADEFADLMMVAGKKVEELIARLAQKARAAGIHLILATQRPSVDVITGLIKANIPTRISFQVSSKIDSRTVLDQPGAEQLLGHGDMLYLAPGTGVPVRVHGAYVADDEVHRVVQDWKRRGQPSYLENILEGDGMGGDGGLDGFAEGGDSEQDPLYDQAVAIVMETKRASISLVQRRLKIGYNRAANIMEAMEKAGLVSAMENNGLREVLVPGAE